MSIGLESSDISFGMFALSCAFESAGTVAGSNATLCGPPPTTVNFTASPDLIVISAGSKRYPLSSPIILISCVAPVAATGATAPAAGVAGVAGFAVLAGGAFVVSAVLLHGFYSLPALRQ